MDELCMDIIRHHIHKKVADARIDLGYHFAFDFDYMLFSKPNQTHIYIHGPGEYVRIYDLMAYYLLDHYIEFKPIYKLNENPIIEYIKTNDDGYCIKILADYEKDQFITNMTIYFQKYIIRNRKYIVDNLELNFNR
jgi:hypothetical protein